MGLRRIISERSTVRQLAQEDVARLQEELNFRLFMESEATDRVLWVEEITVTGFTQPGWRRRIRERIKMWLRRAMGSFRQVLECLSEEPAAFKNKK